MGKNIRNKQADLLKKLELAKKQNKVTSEETESESPASASRLTDKEVKERNDRLRFEELLKRDSSTVLNDYSSEGYLNKQQEEEEIVAAREGVDRIFEGDPAPSECFEELVSIRTENAICKKGSKRILPWLRKNQDRQGDYLVVISDPRMKSSELRQTVKSLVSSLPVDVLRRVIIVNADSPAENRRWLKKTQLGGKIEVYSDEKLEWMRAYTALGEKRWSMTMFVLANGRVQKLAREVDMYAASRVVRNAVQSLNEAQRI